MNSKQLRAFVWMATNEYTATELLSYNDFELNYILKNNERVGITK